MAISQKAARDVRRVAVEQALLELLWPGKGLGASEKPRLQKLLASPEYQGLLQVQHSELKTYHLCLDQC